MSNIIELKNVNKWFDKFQVLKDINLQVNLQEKIVICGPSGSGKSTLIRCINRLEEHQEGKIVVDGNEISENTKNIESIRAEVGMVFQQFNLFPHLSILDNCTLAPIWVKKLPKKKAEEIAMDNLKQVQIEEMEKAMEEEQRKEDEMWAEESAREEAEEEKAIREAEDGDPEAEWEAGEEERQIQAYEDKLEQQQIDDEIDRMESGEPD